MKTRARQEMWRSKITCYGLAPTVPRSQHQIPPVGAAKEARQTQLPPLQWLLATSYVATVAIIRVSHRFREIAQCKICGDWMLKPALALAPKLTAQE
ncbi:hypothetical protein M728_005609 (plasmid) [Ensifer sp. WSM1721]